MRLQTAAALLSVLGLSAAARAAEWEPKQAPLMTRWARDVDPQKVLPEYPRPQMVRERNWKNLNGLWDYAVTGKDAERPEDFDGQILVPFPIESALSGVMQRVGPDQKLWYRLRYLPDKVKSEPPRDRTLLHFGAVDWECEVWINGTSVGTHRGGYDPFTFDITEFLTEGNAQEILVAVTDPTSAGTQPIGKQHLRPHGIWYTPTTGIWQTVWLERVPQNYIKSLRITPDLDAGEVAFEVDAELAAAGLGPAAGITVEVLDGGKVVAKGQVREGVETRLAISQPKLWTPDDPHLYDVRVAMTIADSTDRVGSYFGMRKISVGQEEDGTPRLLLNNQELFQYGLLDQGFWPDGLYTAPTDDALKYDIEMTKKLGFNMARKHVKVEPARWYYWCDRLGLLVWQDMPSGGGKHIGPNDPDMERTPESAEQYVREWTAIIDALRNHPSIVMWVPFNEGWGQFGTERIAKMTKEYDPSRLVNSVSGWADRGAGDVHDVHIYPGPGMPPVEQERAAVLGEFGGLGLPIEGHTWQDKENWGYRTYETNEALTDAYLALVSRLRPLIGQGLAAAVYTQTTDVEIEVNGLLTYDRAVLKMPEEKLRAAHAKLHLPPPEVVTLLPTSESEPQRWHYTTDEPTGSWHGTEFEADGWKQASGGFGERSTPGSVVRTEWKTQDIWLRRTFDLKSADLAAPHLRIHHDEDAEVYLNGEKVAEVKGYTTDYVLIPLGGPGVEALREGENVLAVHCHQTGGGQYIDVGLVDVREVEK